MTKHAILSASSSHRWLKCPPSALLCSKVPDKGSDYALQGTDAHSLAEYKVNRLLGNECTNPTENLTFFDEEMASCTDAYEQYIAEQFAVAKEHCKDPVVLVEQRLDFSRYVPSGFGTGDCVIVADDELHVIDFKYGTGILVEAEGNPQMMCYALGALELFDALYDINTISMTIFQPRREHISTYTITKNELLEWTVTELKPKAVLAAKGEGEFKAGNHCLFCKVKATCRKRAEYNLQLAKYDFAMPPNLDDTEVEAVLAVADGLVAWVNDIKDYALKQALGGKNWQDWKLVEGRATRKYVNDKAVAELVSGAGYDPYEHKVLGITAMTKLLGKKKFEELTAGLIEKPAGKPTLVPISDKRKAINVASDDFKEEI